MLWLCTRFRRLCSYSFSLQPSRSDEIKGERKHDSSEPETQDLVTTFTNLYNFIGCLGAAALYYYLTLYWSDYLYTFDTILTVYLAEHCGWANERVRKNSSTHERGKNEVHPDLSVVERGEYRTHPKRSPKLELGCIAAIVGYREDPVIFTKALESYLDAEGCQFVLTCIDGNEIEDQVMVDVFRKVCRSIFVFQHSPSYTSADDG